MLTEDLSQQTVEHLARIEESQDTETMDYIPWETCLSDTMLYILFSSGVKS